MGCLSAVVIVMILILILYNEHKNTTLILKATNLLGSPMWMHDQVAIWILQDFKLSIACDTKLPVQLYFTLDPKIIRPRNELYQILSRVCTDTVNYDVGSSKFTVKDKSIENAFTIMDNILDTH
jgi:hypothetical protein